MTEDETIMQRVITSYKMMLDFYGMRLENEATGLISRSKDYVVQYRNLCSTLFCLDLFLQPDFAPSSDHTPCRTPYASLRGPEILSYPSAHFVYSMMSHNRMIPLLTFNHYVA